MTFIYMTDNICMAEICEYWPAPPDDPQGIRVASVFEFSVCLFVYGFLANFLIYLYTQNIDCGQ